MVEEKIQVSDLKGNKSRLQVLDLGRMLAAIAVLLFHYRYYGVLTGKVELDSGGMSGGDIVKYGYLGVPFFFMLSGYVIYFSTKHGKPVKFLVSRARRLYPTFWICVSISTVFSLLGLSEWWVVSFKQYVFNLTMIAPILGQKFVDGVYWTLLLEIKFYALVFVLLLFRLGTHLRYVFLGWPLLILMVELFFSQLGRLEFLGGHYSFFAAGAFMAASKGLGFWFRIPVCLGCVFSCSSVLLSKFDALEAELNIEYSPALIVVFCAAFVLFFLALEWKVLKEMKVSTSSFFGGVSYPLYLLHAHIGYSLIAFASPRLGYEVSFWLAFLFAIALSSLVQFICEIRLKNFWNTVFFKPIAKVEK